MTDNEIAKTLECCASSNFEECRKCPLHNDFYPNLCHCERDKNALNLINRQKVEIERLKNENKKQQTILEAIDDEMFPLPFETDFGKAIKTAKSEAIKEFAERLKEKTDNPSKAMFDVYEFYGETIDSLVKEMTESKK